VRRLAACANAGAVEEFAGFADEFGGLAEDGAGDQDEGSLWWKSM